jgi:hypothetical protein
MARIWRTSLPLFASQVILSTVFLSTVFIAGSRPAAAQNLLDLLTPTPLHRALHEWTTKGGNLSDALLPLEGTSIKTTREAEALVAALVKLRTEPKRMAEARVTSPLFELTALFQRVDGKEAEAVLRKRGLPELRPWVRYALDEKKIATELADDGPFILKILAYYGEADDMKLLAEAARKLTGVDERWSMIFGSLDPESPNTLTLIDLLRDSLPAGTCRVAYLDLANNTAIAGGLKRHPFATPAGREQLAAWLADPNRHHYPYAKSAAAALAFVDEATRTKLLPVADAHPDGLVRLEGAWARAHSGDAAGITALAKLALDPRYTAAAREYLVELNRADAMPKETEEKDFQALATFSAWISQPQEMGRVPDKLERLDSRELFWPPTADRRRLWLVKYEFEKLPDQDAQSGVGLIGTTPFALFDAAATLSPEDLYGLYCCWELEVAGDPRAPKERTTAAGRKLLAEKNKGF